MPDRLAIVNTSPLLHLQQIEHLALLPTLYSQVIVPAAVQRELQAGAAQGLSIPPLVQEAVVAAILQLTEDQP